MGYQHGLGVGAFEDKDILRNGMLLQVPRRLGLTVSGATPVFAIFPQGKFTMVDLTQTFNPATAFGGSTIDYIIPQYDWFRGPLYLVAYGTGNVSNFGNSQVAVTLAYKNEYGFSYDPTGGMTPRPGDEVASGGSPYDPNPLINLTAPFAGISMRLPKGMWYHITS